MAETKHQLPQFTRDAEVRPSSFNADDNTIEIVWTTGAAVRRYSWLDDEEYDEVLSLDAGAVRLDRLNLGAPFLDTHCSYELRNVIGSVVPGTAKVEDGKGICRILLSRASGDADTVSKIKDGVIRNISVGYWIHKVVKTSGSDTVVARWEIVDWEPLEISAVPIPADPGSQVRSESSADGAGRVLRACTFVTPDLPARGPKPTATKESRMATAPKKPAPKKSAAERLAAAEAENVRLLALLAKRDADEDEKKDDDERDDEADDARAEDDADDKDDKADDERDGDDEDKKDDDAEKDDERAAPKGDARSIADAAVKAERERSAKIRTMAARAGLAKLGEKHIDKGTSVRRFGDLLLERMLDKQGKDETQTPGVTGERSLAHEGRSQAPTKEQRDMENGAAHWRKLKPLTGKPDGRTIAAA